ncbi:ATP-binding protein [Actinomadura rubrisoli]|uniref:AAA family ATPase n=1 Tax=Actinomadura rubrisoli TaxID=2530368 RepID=A0A4R5C7R8_9ACTN|nr:ATP-binding protein [Actinomadura rubrisoli]TDD94150.1 AAA family ATPase [Actinomadura rubrisoli]
MAWFAAHLLTEDRLPGWASGHRIVGVGSQTARSVDDVGAVTDAGGWLMVQAKKRLQRTKAEDGALAEALRQLVDAVICEVPSSPPNQHMLRSLDRDLDRVLLLGDEHTPATVRDHLAKVTDRLRTHPEAVPLEEAATNRPEREALGVLLAHLRRLWEEREGRPADDAALRRLLRPLVVRALNLRDDGQEYQRVQVMLSDMLVDQDQARDLWDALVSIGHELGESQRWLDRDALVAELEERPFRLRPVTRVRGDIARLRQTTRANVAVLGSALTLTTPEGGLTLERGVGPTLRDAEGSFALTGEPGTGKTALLCQLAADLIDQGNDVVLLSAEQLRASAGQTRTELNLEHDLKDILLGWPGTHPGRLLLDGLDQTRGENASQWLPTLAKQLAGSRWEIVATVRRFDLRNGHKWRAMFRGAPVDPAHSDSTLQNVRHLLVEDLLPGEMESLVQESPALAELLGAAGSRMQQLLGNPFNLEIASQLLAEGALLEPGSIRSRLDLLDQYWRVRVVKGGKNPWERASTLTYVVAQMIADRRQQVTYLPHADADALQGLVSDGVLRDLPQGVGVPQPPIAFSHPVLFDFAAGILALGDTSRAESLAEKLDADPNLALLLRPSLDYRLAIAWRNAPTKQEFWQLALRLNAETSGHHLAAAAAATACSRELRSPDELAHLAEACLGNSPATEACENPEINARRMAFLVAAAIANSDSQTSLFRAFLPFVRDLARAARATDDTSLALDAAQFLRRASGPGISWPDAEVRDHRVQVVVDCMTVALEDVDDPDRAQIGRMLAWPLAHALSLDGTACERIAHMAISHEVLRAWGFEIARVLIECLPSIVERNAALAVEIAAAPWEYEEDREQVTRITESQIFGLTSNLQQDLNHLRWSVCQELPEVASADLEAAVRMLIRIVEVPRMFQCDRSTDTGRRPRIRYGDTLRYAGGHSELGTAVDAVIALLQTRAEHASSGLTNADKNSSADQQELRQVVELLISALSHGEVWQRLLMQAANAESPALAHLLVPALETGIFERGQTRGTAGLVAARLSSELDIAIHRRIEAAILSATSLEADEIDDTRRQEWQREQRDALLGALDPRKVTEPGALRHLEELASSDRDDRGRSCGHADRDLIDDSLPWPAGEPRDDDDGAGGGLPPMLLRHSRKQALRTRLPAGRDMRSLPKVGRPCCNSSWLTHLRQM